MKTTSKKIATAGATMSIVAALLALSGVLTPVFAATQPTANTASSTAGGSAIPQLAVGQTITVTSTQGHFRVVGENQTGPASGTVTFTVTGKFARGYSLSLTAGSLTVNGTGYSISSGSAEMGRYAHTIVAQGTSTSGTASEQGTFLMRATARGTFAGEFATASFDLQSGTSEYAISLVGNIQG